MTADRDLVTVAQSIGEPLLLELDHVLASLPAQPAPDSLTVAVDGCRALCYQAWLDAPDLDDVLTQVAVANQSPALWQVLRSGLIGLVGALQAIPNVEAGIASAALLSLVVREVDGRRLDNEVAQITLREQLDSLE